MRRIDHDALYGFLSRMFNPNQSAPHRTELDAAFPEVEPERPEPVCVGPGPDNYGDGWGFDIIHEPLPGPTKPAEAVIDKPESDCPYCLDGGGLVLCRYNEGDGCSVNCPYCGGDGTETRRCREPRSSACGGSSERSSSVSSSEQSEPSGSSRGPSGTASATDADDPRRLTNEELWDAYGLEYSYGAKAAVLSCIRPVADAQFEKAAKPVTISEAEIDAAVREIHSFRCRAEIVKALLRSKGVEVVP